MSDFNLFGFDWRVGRVWGVAHPNDICYADGRSVVTNSDGSVSLGIAMVPKEFNNKTYLWSVGYISTIDAVKYGYLKVDFQLPVGDHLWPAIWMYDCETWPPEVDIVEGVSGLYKWPFFKPKEPADIYKVNPFANAILPTLHLGTNEEEHWSKAYKRLGGTCPQWLDVMGTNTCEFLWTPSRMVVKYNGHTAMDETDTKILKYFNNSKGMCIHLNNYVTNDFDVEDYKEMCVSDGYTKWFRIMNLFYDPDYKKYMKQKSLQ